MSRRQRDGWTEFVQQRAAVSQESVFRGMSAYLAGDNWAAVMRLAVEESERTFTEANPAGASSHQKVT